MNTQINITDQAKNQIQLILENDFTLQDKVLRVSVDGKGCDGFDFAIGFTDPDANDNQVSFENISIHLDQFVTEHLTNFTIDFKTDYQNNDEGFVIINNEPEKTRGKFWLKK